MSGTADRRAVTWDTGSSIQRHVLLFIAATTDHVSGWSKVTLEGLARGTGYARSTVAEVVRWWTDIGALERRGTRGRNSNEYRVLEPSGNSPPKADGWSARTVRQPSGNRPATVRQRRPDQGRCAEEQGTGNREQKNPPTPRALPEPEVLPALAPKGAMRAEAAGFAEFWSSYPRKVARSRAEAAFRQAVKRDGPDVIITGLRTWTTHWRDAGTEEQFIPHPTTWLGQARYLGRPPPPAQPRPMSAAQHDGDVIRRLLALDREQRGES